MYEPYSQQALPSKQYRELLGSALCVFNSNTQFVIENILRINSSDYDWYELTDRTSGELNTAIEKTISREADLAIANLFSDLVSRRNRIVHSFQITKDSEQILHTKDRNHNQFTITNNYLLEFIKDNGELSTMLHELRGN